MLHALALVVLLIVLLRLGWVLVQVAVGVLVWVIVEACWLVGAAIRRMRAAGVLERATIRRRLRFDVPPRASPRAASVAWDVYCRQQRPSHRVRA